MIFSNNEIEEILSIIDSNSIVYITATMGVEILTDNDRTILKQHGINPDNLYMQYPPFLQSFYFGRLSMALGDKNTKSLTYADFTSYLKKGQYVPMTKKEENMYNIAKSRTYTHIKGLGETMKQTVNGIIVEEDLRKRQEYEKIIHDEIATGIAQRKSIKNIISEIGHRTGDWQRNLGRIVQTEYNTIYQEGRMAEIIALHGEDSLVYKDVYPKACRHCIRAYLTDGIGSEPRVFKLSTLIANGTNIGVKMEDAKPVIGSFHPWCRCQLRFLPKNQQWDKDKKDFVYKRQENKPEANEKNHRAKITVGDKVFYV
jgi:hypothetical protein